jgi:predicted DNA-binding WGR domain protein
MRRFELVEGSSSKFWEVEVEGCDVTVRFGRIGTSGQSKTKTFADEPAAKKEHAKLVKEKAGKGYVESNSAPGARLAAVKAPAATAIEPPDVRTPIPTPALASSAAPEPPTAATAGSIEWPLGGFQWSDELREALPVVRGIHAPPAVDAAALLARPIAFVDDKHGHVAVMLSELGTAIGRTWTPWNAQRSAELIQREHLARADREFWLELCAQAAVARLQDQPAFGSINYQRNTGVQWVAEVGIALHGLPFVIEVALDMLRSAPSGYRFLGMANALYEPLLRVIAASNDADHDAAIDTLERQAGSTPLDRRVRANLCPHRTDWALQSIADGPIDEQYLLRECVLPVDVALTYFKPITPYYGYFEGALLLQIHLHGSRAFDLLAQTLRKAADRDNSEKLLALVLRMHEPQTLALLAELIERKEVRAALDKLSQRYPAAVLKSVVEHALATRSRLAEGWAVRLALREPAALAQALPALDASDRARFEGLLQALQSSSAEPEQLPALLREPPWLRKARASELPTLDVSRLSTPERLEWTADEQARHAAYKSARQARYPNTLPEDYLIRLQISPAGRSRVLAGQALEPADVVISQKYFYGEAPELALLLPDAAAIALWNSYPAKYWYSWSDLNTQVSAILARHGQAAMPGLGAFVQTHPEDGLAIALPIDSARIVPTALHALRNLKKAKAAAIAWLRAHANTALTAALPVAFGKSKAERDDAQFGVRWLAGNGFETQAREVAATYGAEMSQALQALLDADPLLVLPSRMPKLPSFFVAASFRRPELRDSGAALPTTAMEHIGSMLAISKLEAPYAGLAVVKDACTASSLAEFAWDLFEAWSAAGNPSKDGWAFAALGLLGNDETARRLAPRIREWPGESQHQRAVTGLDLLAAIGSDVALMHLNGIASKVKFKGLQDRAKEKIAAVAEARGFTAAELADRLVPDLGLDEQGTLMLDFGQRRFFVAFDETLKPFVKDAQGARLKDLPKPIKSDDAALADAATERYKQIKKDAKAVASLQVVRLELAMIDRRRWNATDFRLFFIEHPLMRHLAARLMWGVYGGDDALATAFRVAEDWTLADAQDSLYTLPDDAQVGIAHVLEMPAPLQAAFGQVFADYEILQPFKQLGRETYALTDAERQGSKITRYANKVVATGSVMGLVNRGWERGQAQDAGWVGWFSKRVGDKLQVDLELDPGTVVGDLSFEPKQKLPGIVLRETGTWDSNGLLNFERLHPIAASEVLRDIELLAPFKDA